jgi:hypothetical protein
MGTFRVLLVALAADVRDVQCGHCVPWVGSTASADAVPLPGLRPLARCVPPRASAVLGALISTRRGALSQGQSQQIGWSDLRGGVCEANRARLPSRLSRDQTPLLEESPATASDSVGSFHNPQQSLSATSGERCGYSGSVDKSAYVPVVSTSTPE